MDKIALMKIVFILTIVSVREAVGGCFQKNQCCPRKNNSCTASENSSSHVTPNAYSLLHHDSPTPETEDNYRSGPDLMIEKVHKSNKMPKRFYFGEEVISKEHPEPIIEYKKGAKSAEIRFVNKEIPYAVIYDDDENGREKSTERSGEITYRYFEGKSRRSEYPTCYCDEYCIKYGDCCSDYTITCHVQDCIVDSWNQWTTCIPDDRSKRCGTGVQTRTRQVIRHSRGGGEECPALVEKRTCFKNCSRRPSRGTSTAALLLDYKFHEIGERQIDPGRRYVHKDVDLDQLQFYCVKYKLGWVNRNCLDSRFKPMLYEGNTICVECQPDAQMHRPDARCAMDLEDGDTGFWKLLGPQSCNGIWTRQFRVDDCRCGKKFNDTDSFLFV